ncbi:MAG: sugar transporter substrate-binding protein [Paenibacillus sp.]|jgi:multiple sugar transport system substrate-binding protein|nr:sugar transporter substrate-binding protein [Paenibacillus sp.]
MQLRIATHDDQRMAVIQEAARQFRKDYPGVTLVLEYVPDRKTMRRQAAEGNGADIVEWEGANMGQCLESGLLSDLSDLIARDRIDMGDYYPSVHEAVHSDGRIGAIPVMADTLGVFYNRDHFEQAGLSNPRENWTWEEFVAAAERLTLRDEQGDISRYGVFASFGYMIYVEPVVWNCGGAFLSEDGTTLDGFLNSEATIEGVRRYLRLIDERLSPRMEVSRDSWIDCFIHGKMSMYIASNGTIGPMKSEQRAKFGVAGFPRDPGKPNLFEVYGYGISTSCRERELAWAFLRKLTAPESEIGKLWSVLKLAVSQTAAEQSGQAADPLYAPFLRELRSARLSAYQWPNMIPAFHYRDTFRTMAHAEDVEQALQAAVRRTPTLPAFDPVRFEWW